MIAIDNNNPFRRRKDPNELLMRHQKSPDSATAEELQKMIQNKKHTIKHELEEVKEKVQNFQESIKSIDNTLKHS